MLAVIKQDPQALRDIAMMGERQIKYPFHELSVGDSFVVSDEKDHRSARTMASARSKDGRKFVARLQGDGLRISRIA